MFRRRAEELHAALQGLGLPQLQLRLNPFGAPRRGAFELNLSAGGSEDQVQLWSGLKRGPPRALKFPNAEEMHSRIEEILEGKKNQEDKSDVKEVQKEKEEASEETLEEKPKPTRKRSTRASTEVKEEEEKPSSNGQTRKRATRSSTEVKDEPPKDENPEPASTSQKRKRSAKSSTEDTSAKTSKRAKK